METTAIMDTVHLKQLTPQALMDVVNNCFYPELFDQLSHISTQLDHLKNDDMGLVLSLLLQNLTAELDYLQNKEKIVLFPYLLHLHNENKSADNLKPFEIARSHFDNMLCLLNKFCDTLLTAEQHHHTRVILLLAQTFQKDAKKMQELKQQYLFSKFIEAA